MKGFLLAAVAVALASVAMGADDVGNGTTFEDFDVDKVFGDQAKLKSAMGCLLDKEPCGELKPLRDAMPTLIETDCSVCTPKQKEKYDQVKKTLTEKFPEFQKSLLDKYSPKSE